MTMSAKETRRSVDGETPEAPRGGCGRVGARPVAPEMPDPRPLRPHPNGGEIRVAENLRVVTGPAEYGRPEIQHVL